MNIPEWLPRELQELYERDNGWLSIRKQLPVICTRLGRDLSQQDVYDILFPDHSMAPCGKTKIFKRFDHGYRFPCEGKCACRKESRQEKSQETYNERYGDHPSRNPENRARARATNVKRYGVEHALQSPIFKKKTRETSMAKYGVEHVLQSPEVREKGIVTNLERLGVEHALQNSEVREKSRETNLARYGVEHVMQSPEIKDKARKTNQVRYGVEHVLQNPDILKKARDTTKERYGVEQILHNSEIKEKVRLTNIEKYGVENVSQNSNIGNKTQQTNLERYGVRSTLQNPETREKSRKTILKKYGFDHATQNVEVREKVRLSNIERYGVDNFSQRNIPQSSLDILRNKDLLQEMADKKSINTLSTELGIDPSTFYNYWHKHELPILSKRSGYESEIEIFLNSMGVKFETNNRSLLGGKELDFYLPDHNLAIEFNGLYWHSDLFKERLYHRKKYEGCQGAGIRLLMINQDEWDERAVVIKSRIRNILGLSERGVGARKLHLREVNYTSAQAFFQKHHVQGKTGSIRYAMGAWDQDDLVGVMAFNQQRNTQAVELVRYATDGKTYAGLFSRMLNRSVKEKQYQEILSFADLRYSEGHLYEKNGFEFVGEIPPDYRYVYQKRTWHKSSFTKKKINEKFDLDMSEMTEREAMRLLGIPRIYDCGKLKYLFRQ